MPTDDLEEKMNWLFCISMGLAAVLPTLSLAADDPNDKGGADAEIAADAAMLKYPMANADELKQVLFSGTCPDTNAPTVVYELHNPSRDKVIAGFVVTIAYTDTVSGKPVRYEQAITDACGPLDSIMNQKYCFGSLPEKGTVVSLKEVHFFPEKTPAK